MTPAHEEVITSVASTTGTAKSSDATGTAEEVISSSSTFANGFFLFAIFGLVIAAFIWIGGARYIARFLPSNVQARYSKLAADEDLVK